MPTHLATLRESTRSVLLLAAVVIVLATIWLPQPVDAPLGPLLLLSASTALTALLGLLPYIQDLLNRYGGLLVLGHVVVLVLLTGGPQSVYLPLFGMLILYAALYYETGRLVATGVLILVALVATYATSSREDVYLAGLLVMMPVWVCTVVVVHHLVNHIRRSAQTDGLTRLWNHAAFWALLRQEHERLRRGGEHYSVVMADIDHFKSVNDERGHVAGDEVLRSVAALLGRRCRASDILARYGGEEFALLLPATSPDAAAELAEDLRSMVAEAVLPAPVTISAGVAGSRDGYLSAEGVLAAADRSLYRAKKKGRNQVAVAGRRSRPRKGGTKSERTALSA